MYDIILGLAAQCVLLLCSDMTVIVAECAGLTSHWVSRPESVPSV